MLPDTPGTVWGRNAVSCFVAGNSFLKKGIGEGMCFSSFERCEGALSKHTPLVPPGTPMECLRLSKKMPLQNFGQKIPWVFRFGEGVMLVVFVELAFGRNFACCSGISKNIKNVPREASRG